MGRKNNRRSPQEDSKYVRKRRHSKPGEQPEETFHGAFEGISIDPKTPRQQLYVNYLNDPSVDIVFGVGPAGTGKTMLASAVAAAMLLEGDVKKIIVTRPAVGADGEKHGFLPGDINEKMSPWIRPIIQHLSKVYPPGRLKSLRDYGTIEAIPLAYMRGLSFDDSVIILDEAQNCTEGQLKMLLTRIGNGSKVFVAGDLEQHDKDKANNGLKDFLRRLDRSYKDPAGIAVVYFTNEDIQRHPVIDVILNLYREEQDFNVY